MGDYPRMVVTPPGPRARALVEKDKVLISPSYVRFYPLVIESARGCILRDVDGNEYIDFNNKANPRALERLRRVSAFQKPYSPMHSVACWTTLCVVWINYKTSFVLIGYLSGEQYG